MNINLRNFALIPVLFALSACMQPARLTGDDSREHNKKGAPNGRPFLLGFFALA